MRQLLASAWVIARRDYRATVFSRIFILFLLTPLFSLFVGGLMTLLAHRGDEPPSRPAVALLTDRVETQALVDARARLAPRLGEGELPDLVPQPLAATGENRGQHLLRARQGGHPRFDAVLAGPLSHPALMLSSGAPDRLGDDIALVVDGARAGLALGGRLPPPVALDAKRVPAPRPFSDKDRVDLAGGAQTALFFMLVLLSGMMLSTFVEEKSNKVIEVLAAAVPVDAIFLGKLAAMLAVSLSGILIWVGAAAAGVLAFFPRVLAHIAEPAVGWPVFALLMVVYFIVSYLLLGAVFLGLGSQANSPREVQSMAMPVTMLQLVLFAFVSAGVARPHGWVALAAAVFPWSSPLAMLGRGAELPALWPHLLAFGWQMLWLVLALRFAASRFRSAVLKSGGDAGWWPWRRRAA